MSIKNDGITCPECGKFYPEQKLVYAKICSNCRHIMRSEVPPPIKKEYEQNFKELQNQVKTALRRRKI